MGYHGLAPSPPELGPCMRKLVWHVELGCCKCRPIPWAMSEDEWPCMLSWHAASRRDTGKNRAEHLVLWPWMMTAPGCCCCMIAILSTCNME